MSGLLELEGLIPDQHQPPTLVINSMARAAGVKMLCYRAQVNSKRSEFSVKL